MSESRATASEAAFVVFRARGDRAAAELALVEACEAGASGAEEEPDGALIVYAPAARARAVRAALVFRLGEHAVGSAAPVAAGDWPETWKQGLRPVVVSERLVVRPPFAAHRLEPGQVEVVIEPRQAFGTGAHATTVLALEGLDQALAARRPRRVLDLGCGSGVLAIAALRLGAVGAVACDLDPIAARETQENASRNGVAAALLAFVGTLDALPAQSFDLATANLIRRELVPWLPRLVSSLTPRGVLVIAGLLAGEREEIAERLRESGARVIAVRERRDAGGESWLGITATR